MYLVYETNGVGHVLCDEVGDQAQVALDEAGELNAF